MLIKDLNHMAQRIRLNILLDTIIMILLDHICKTSANDWLC